jgi:hypothetical protein
MFVCVVYTPLECCFLLGEMGGEYLVSAAVRGPPSEVLDVLMNGSSNTTILGPASRVQVLDCQQDADISKSVSLGRCTLASYLSSESEQEHSSLLLEQWIHTRYNSVLLNCYAVQSFINMLHITPQLLAIRSVIPVIILDEDCVINCMLLYSLLFASDLHHPTYL